MDPQNEKLFVAFQANPSDNNAFKALSEQLYFHGHWSELVEVYDRRANVERDVQAAAKLFHQAGELAEKKMGATRKAIAFYRKAVGADHNYQPAIADLRRKYVETGDWENAVRVMEDEIRSLPDKGEKVERLLEIAEIFETKIGLIPRALEKYEQVRDFDPLNRKALDNLEKGYRTLSNWDALRDLFDGLIPEIEDEKFKAQILFKLGKLYQNQLDDPIRSARCFELVREINPAVQSIYKELEVLYEKTENWPALARILKEESNLNLPEEEKAVLRKRAASVLGEREETAPAAEPSAKTAPPADPDQTAEVLPGQWQVPDDDIKVLEEKITAAANPAERGEAFLALGRLHLSVHKDGEKARECAVMAADILPPGHEAEPDVARLLLEASGPEAMTSVLGERAARAPDGNARAAVHIVMGDLLADAPGRKKAAIREYQQALRFAPQNRAAQAALEALWADTGHRDGLTTLYRWQMTKGSEADDRRSAALKLADMLAGREGSEEEAERILQGLVSSDERDVDALRALENLYRKLRRYDALAEVYQKYADAHPGQAQAVNALFNVARLYRDTLERPADAVRVYRKILDADPGNRQAESAVEQALEEAADHEGLARHLSERAETADASLRLEILFRLATHLRDRVGDLRRAAEAFEEVHREEPHNLEVLHELESIYRDEESWEDLADVLNRRLASDPGADEAFRLHCAMGELWERKLGDGAIAALAYERAAALRGDEVLPLERLTALHREGERWDEYIRAATRLAHLLPAPRQAALLTEAAETAHRKLDAPQQALELYTEALLIEPGQLAALRGQQAVYEEQGDFAMVANRVLQETAHMTDPGEREKRLRDRGRLLLEKAPAETNTLEVWMRLRDAAGEEEEILEALTAIYRARDDGEQLATVLLQRAVNTDDSEAGARLRLEAAVLFETALSNPGRALSLYREVLDGAPDHPDALEGVERLSEEAGDYEAARASLEAKLAGELSPDDRVVVLGRLAAILEKHLHDDEGAADAYEEILSQRPGDAAALSNVERTFLRTSREARLVDILSSAPLEGEARAQSLLRAADILTRRLYQPETAVTYLCQVLDLEPQNEAALDSLKSLYRKVGRWSDFADLLEREAGLPGKSTSLLLAEAGLTRERRLGDPAAALDLYARATEADPENLVALRSLARVQRKLERFEDLVGTLETQRSLFRGAAAEEVALSLARLHEERLGREKEAVTWYEQVLESNPRHPQALAALEVLYQRSGRRDRLVTVLQQVLDGEADARRKCAVACRLGRLFRDGGDFRTALDHYQRALTFVANATEALRGVQLCARKLGDWETCIDALKSEVALHSDISPRVVAHRALAILYQETNQPDQALDQMRLAFEAQPRSPEVTGEYLALLEQTQRWAELVEVQRTVADFQPTPGAAARVLVRAARTANENLEDAEQAVELLEKAIARDGQCREAFKLLGNILFARGDHKALLDLLDKEIGMQPSDDAKSALLVRAADIVLEHLHDETRAARYLVRAVELDPHNARAARVMGRLKEDVQADLPAHLKPRLGRGLDPDERASALERAARNAEGEKALALWKAVLDTDPLRTDIMHRCREAAEGLGRFREAALWLSMAAAAETDATRAFEMQVELGDFLTVKLDNPRAAFDAYFEAWRRRPDDRSIAERLIETGPEYGKWSEVVEAKIGLASDLAGEEKAAALVEVADLLSSRIGNPENASEFLLAASDLVPENEELAGRVAEHLESLDDYEGLATVLGRKYEALRSRDASGFDLALRLGDLYGDRLGDLNLAIEWYYRALEEDAGDGELLHRLQRILRRAGKYRDLEEILDLEKGLDTLDDKRRFEILDEKARLYEENLADEAMAIDAIETMLELKPGSPDLLARLERVSRRGGYWRNLAQTLVREAETAEAGPNRVDFLLRATDIYLRKLGDRASAREALERILAEDPQNEEARSALDRLEG